MGGWVLRCLRCPASHTYSLTHTHTQATFWLLHWNRGSPFWEDQGEHIDQTVWEQIDNGVPWTSTRKFFIIVPILLCVPCCWLLSHCCDDVCLQALSTTPPPPPPPTPCSFLVCSHFTDYALTPLAINGALLAILIVAKLPEMHGVRIFRINKAPVDSE